VTDQPRRLPLNHEPHPYTPKPGSEYDYCICDLSRTHHLHDGISSATCTYTCCLADRLPDMCGRCYLPLGDGRLGTCSCPADPVPSSPAALLEDQ
jgi:hypothetical protein